MQMLNEIKTALPVVMKLLLPTDSAVFYYLFILLTHSKKYHHALYQKDRRTGKQRHR